MPCIAGQGKGLYVWPRFCLPFPSRRPGRVRFIAGRGATTPEPPRPMPADPARAPDPHPIPALPRLRVLLAAPRGFCAGVDRAVRVVEEALKCHGAPVYVRHEIVHNRVVVGALAAQGAVFVEELDAVPVGARVVFSAHGVAKSVPLAAAARGLVAFDATCPLVSKVHREAERHAAAGRHILMIGHAGHPEVEGTMGQVRPGAMTLVQSAAEAQTVMPPPGPLAFVTQTTLSVEDAAGIVAVLRRRFPAIEGPAKEDICYATTNRQAAVRAVAAEAALVLVLGSANSSNTVRLCEVAGRAGARALLLEGPEALDWSMLHGETVVGITAGASAPESLVQGLLARLGERYALAVEERRVTTEDVTFKLPAALSAA